MSFAEMLQRAKDTVCPPKKSSSTAEKVSVLRPELRVLTGNDRKALMLHEIIFRQGIAEGGWVPMSASKLVELAQVDITERTALRYLSQMVEAGLLLQRPSQRKWERRKEYRVPVEALEAKWAALNQELTSEACPMDQTQDPIHRISCPIESDTGSDQNKEAKKLKEQQTAQQPAAAFSTDVEENNARILAMVPDHPTEEEIKANAQALDALVAQGVDPPVAQSLVKKYTAPACLAQVAALPYRKGKDPTAILVASIMKGYSMPKAMKEQQTEARKQSQFAEFGEWVSEVVVGALVKSVETGKRYVLKGVDKLKGVVHLLKEGEADLPGNIVTVMADKCPVLVMA